MAILLLAVLCGASADAQKFVPGRVPHLPVVVPSKPKLPKKVVILYSHRTLNPMNTGWTEGLLAAFEESLPEPLDIEVEYLDLVETSPSPEAPRWTELLRSKYSNQRVDLVIPVYDPALEYVLANREQVFRGVPIVFCSATEALARMAVQVPGVTGVAFQPDGARTLELIRKLLPETRTLIVLGGASAADRKLVTATLKSMEPTRGDLDIKHWDGFSVDMLRVVLPDQAPGTAILITSCDRDVPGIRYSTVDYSKDVCELTQLPVFSLFDSALGTGVVGGYVISPREQGRLAGKMAAQVLTGECTANIALSGQELNHVALDARQLTRLRIPQGNVPKDARILFSEPVDWALVARYLVLGLIAILLQSVLIGYLLVNRRKRLRAEREARALAGMILTAQEDERSRVARELHDDLSQRLAVASLDVAILEQNLAKKASVTDILSRLKQGLVTICRDVHQLSHRMHSSVLDDLGLEAALRSECNSASERHDLCVEFSSEGVPSRVPHEVSLCLYRILQEALRNAVKHANATGVHVVLKHDGQQLQLEIRDDGVGFDKTLVNSRNGSGTGAKGLGIASLKERVRLVGGTIRIQSAPHEGVTIDVQVPCHAASA